MLSGMNHIAISVTLDGIDPELSRTVLVPATASL